MRFIIIILKYIYFATLRFFLFLLRFSKVQQTNEIKFSFSSVLSKLNIISPQLLKLPIYDFSKNYLNTVSPSVRFLENTHLLRLLCFFLRINLNKDSELLVLKTFNLDTNTIHNDRNISFNSYGQFASMDANTLTQKVTSSIENNSATFSASVGFRDSNINKSQFLENNTIKQPIENAFLHNQKNSFTFLTADSNSNINFSALQDLYNYLKLFSNTPVLIETSDLAYQKKSSKLRKKQRIPKNFKGGSLSRHKPNKISPDKTTVENLKRDLNTLKQIEFLLKNRKLLESNELNISDIEFSSDVKKVMFSKYNSTGPYGNDSKLYTSDLYSKNKLVVSRRVLLTQNKTPIQDLTDFNKSLGFSNFSFSENEEFENSSDVPLGGWFTGQFYFINPFVVLGFVVYSILELLLLIYFMSFFFGNPFDTLMFFLKHPLVYFYDNLSFFPSANYFFSALIFWLVIIFTFQVHILELIDEERFDPPRLSWAFGLLKDFMYTFLFGWCSIFCMFELIVFFDLLISRVFFMGVPGYPNIFAVLFLFFYDIFYILGSAGYFSFYLENFIHLDIKFPSFYFSDYTPLVQRYPLVQPYLLGNPYLDRPNFFLWLGDSLLNFFSGEKAKTLFFTNDQYIILQREIVQDVRKYNYIRKNLIELRFLGQLYARGWNGFNYRLDLQTFIDPILPAEQMIQFDWRLKNTHSNGMYSRLFSSIHLGHDSNQNNLYKKIKLFRGRRLSSRYGYLNYLKEVYSDTDIGDDWTITNAKKKYNAFKNLHFLQEGIRKSKKKRGKSRSFFFRPSGDRFRMLLRENKHIYTKADRNFRNTRRFKSFWSFLPGNDKPRKFFRYRPFLSIKDLMSLPSTNYSYNRAFLKNSNVYKNKNLPIGNYSLRDIYLNNPQTLFSTNLVNEKELALKHIKISKDWKNSKKIFNINHKINRTNHIFKNSSNNRTFLPFSVNNNNFVSDKKIKSLKLSDLSLHSSDYPTQRKRGKSIKVIKHPIYSRRLKGKRLNTSAIPNSPFRLSKKYKFASKIFQNLQPQYLLRPTASFSTFSKIERQTNVFFPGFFNFFFKNSININSGLNYGLSLFFLGFGKFSTHSPIKFMSFDYYYAQNHNFFYSLLDNYLKQNQFRLMLSSKARFKHPLKGGFRHNIDFLYPMLTELRLKEKLVPINFLYDSRALQNYRHLRLDPYESIRFARISKGPCYFLDARIQNWLNFNNVIWNEYYHFFFTRSHKSEGNGSKFCLASYNPMQGPSSYKLFIDSPTLEVPRVGQYFYNYISWLQYKFKWLLYPTSTYKRFDSFRFYHQHSNKKFYFSSLLKFYQMHLFRWQQGAHIFQWNQLQSRNFLMHLFFHKYHLLIELKNLKNLFEIQSLRSNFLNFNSSNNILFSFSNDNTKTNSINLFNQSFFNITKKYSSKPNITVPEIDNFVTSKIFIPSFTSNDFRFFQYVTDLRRWKALQTSYIRDWKFEKYTQYLGPLLYKDDVASLMGFFAPFEYRNQIIVSKMRNDSLRFSVFFPKKIIDEQFIHPTKRLSFPPQKFRSRKFSKYGAALSNSKPMYYAFVINKPFLTGGSNYSFFSRKGKKFLSGLYPNLERFNYDADFNIVSKNNEIFENTPLFYELNSSKKRFLKDKSFWFSKTYELQEIRDRLTSKFDDSTKSLKLAKFRKVVDQLGKPLDVQITTGLPRLQLIDNKEDINFNLIDSSFKKHNFFENNSGQNTHEKQLNILPRIYPDIFMRFGGPKANSRRWHMGQSWMKFVIASQNVSVFPSTVRSRKYYKNTSPKLLYKGLDRIPISNFFSSRGKGFTGKPFQNRYDMSHEIKDKHGYFNFGLSGIGRLPRLSRSFFHMLFFRNKLDSFKKLKIQFLKLYLMSFPLFHNTDFISNSSFKDFWSFMLGFRYSKYSYFAFRYNLLFNNFSLNRVHLDFSNFVHHPNIGTLISTYNFNNEYSSDNLILHNQYNTFKSFFKFKKFLTASYINDKFYLQKNRDWDSNINFLQLGFFKNNHFSLFYNFIFYGKMLLTNWFTSFSFNFFNYFFTDYSVFNSKNSTSLLYVDLKNKSPSDSNNFRSFKNFFKFENINSNSDYFRSKLYSGTFRNKLHWYHYPVHYYFSFHYFVSDQLASFLFDLLNLSFKINSKYSTLVYTLSSNYISFINRDKNNVLLYLKENLSFISFNSNGFLFKDFKINSNFFFSFENIYLKLTRFENSSFLISITNRISNLEFLRNLFLYNNSNSIDFKYFLTFNSFFFNQNFLFSFPGIINQINLGPNFNFKSSDLLPGLETMSKNLYTHTVSIDGSGRHNRPKSISQTLDKIYTYREYEKYRHEHHRQRFRGITPHWVQNTFKNRTNFKYFFRSSDYQKRKATRVLLNKMFRYVQLSRSKFSPQRLSRISFSNFLGNNEVLHSLLSNSNVQNMQVKSDFSYSLKNDLTFVDTVTKKNLVDYNKSNFLHSKFFETSPDLKYFNLKKKRALFLLDFLEEEYSNPSANKKIRMDQFFRYKTSLFNHSFNKFSFSRLLEDREALLVDFKEENPFWFNLKKKKKKYRSEGPSFFKFDFMKSSNKRVKFFPLTSNIDNPRKKSSNLRHVFPAGFHSNGGNFVNIKNKFSLGDTFQTPVSYNLRKNGFYSNERYVKKYAKAFNSKTEYPHLRRSLKQSITEPLYRTSPRYLRTLKSRRHIRHILTSNTIGGSSSTSRSNSFMRPHLFVETRTKRRTGLRRSWLKHPHKYPSNVKRFIRPFSKVIMSIPYMYSKWFTQNPRLSISVNNDNLQLFINNRYDEFNYICVQSLILLKRKMMSNVINIKLLSYKNKILYFSNLNDPVVSTKAIDSKTKTSNFISYVSIFVEHAKIFFNSLRFDMVLSYLYQLRNKVLISLFQDDFSFVRLLYNPLINRYRHDSEISSDLLFFQDFYYKQTAKRILSQIAFSSHSVGGWNNPLGLSGQYIPGLNFYSKGPLSFNFSYQYPDFFSGRFFSPEILLDNNLIRQNVNLFDRNYFFNEFLIDSNYKKSWHFLSSRIPSPLSPFIEYEKPHYLIFQRNLKNKHFRLPLMSLRRVRNIYPNHLQSFFSTLITDNSNLPGHDMTLPLKLKLLNFDFKKEPYYRRSLSNFFQTRVSLSNLITTFSTSLKYKQFKILSDFHNRMNLSTLVNKRRFGLRKQVWSSFRYNFYYKFNWHTFLHKFHKNDFVGFRNYKLSPYFDLYHGFISRSLKLRAFQHLIVSQIPRFELDSRRRVPLNFSSKEFNLLFFYYFNFVNNNFSDKGYHNFGSKLLKYVNRKINPYSPSYFFEGNRNHFLNFWNYFDKSMKSKIEKNSSNFMYNVFLNNRNSLSPKTKTLKKVSRRLVFKHNNFILNYFLGNTFLNLSHRNSFLRPIIKSKFQNSEYYKSLFIKTTKMANNFTFCYFIPYGIGWVLPQSLFINSSFLIQSMEENPIKFFFITVPIFVSRYIVSGLVYTRSCLNFTKFLTYTTRDPYFYSYFLSSPTFLNFRYLQSPFFKPFLFNYMFYNFNPKVLGLLLGHSVKTTYNYHGFPKSIGNFSLSRFFETLKDLSRPYFSISRIFGVNTLYNFKKSRERFLNPETWLSYDLFSRVRPSFRPFLYKFSKQFMFSKFIPSRGISSYNTFIKSHTLYDSFFERHPYISFSIGLNSLNDQNQLISTETMYKEIRRRSNILDFSRRHLKVFNPLNFHNRTAVRPRSFKKQTSAKYFGAELLLSSKSRKRKHRFYSDHLFRIKSKSKYSRKYEGSLYFLRKMSRHFLSSKVKGLDIDPDLNEFRFPLKTSSRNFLEYFHRFQVNQMQVHKKKFFSVIPLKYRFNGILKNANYYSYMTRPRRRLRFLNTFLIRPYNTLLKFIRFDNYSFTSLKFISTFLQSYGSLNPINDARLRSYYQPNLKLFFDFNAYKQRYNLGLLFRNLSFENDFQFFLFRRYHFRISAHFQTSLNNFELIDFLKFSSFDLFNLIIPKTPILKGFIIDSKYTYLNLVFEKVFLKINFLYFLLIFIDFYLSLLHSLFSLFSQLYFFDFSFFLNFFQITDNSIYYIKKRPIFQIFFHIAHLNEYLKFSWLFSMKFLIFNFEYYPYYFLFFSFLLILRLISYNVKKTNKTAPFIVPHNFRFSDFRLNSHSGWFDDAWHEIKSEALERVHSLHSSNSLGLDHDHLVNFNDLKRIKRRYQFKTDKITLSEEEEDENKPKIVFAKYERAASTDEMFQKPIDIVPLKQFLSKLWLPSFLIPSIDTKNSDKMQLLDADVKSKVSAPYMPGTFEIDLNQEISKEESILNMQDRSNLSFFFLKNQFYLLFSGRISLFKFFADLNFGTNRIALDRLKDSHNLLNNYNIDDFSEELSRLFLNQNSEFNLFSYRDLRKKRMFPEDENIHFYRKPGSILQSELMSRKRGTETDQLYYVIEFPGKYNNSYLNTFSKAYAIRNLNYNNPYYGFFTFSKHAKLPTTFEEFLTFCSEKNSKIVGVTENPQDISLQPNLDKMKELWNVFQYVTKYEYNMFNDFDFQDIHLIDTLLKIEQGDHYTLFDNLKFWFNKASTDAIDLNFWNRRFYFNDPRVTPGELNIHGTVVQDNDNTDNYLGSDTAALNTVSPTYSLFYIFSIYLVFFIFFIFISFFFCSIFLFFYFLYNYVVFFF